MIEDHGSINPDGEWEPAAVDWAQMRAVAAARIAGEPVVVPTFWARLRSRFARHDVD